MSQQPTPPPPSAPIEIYLGKDGERFGPFTVEQFEAMRAQPDFATYTYIWDGRDAKPDWRAIEKAPPPPMPVSKPGPGAPPLERNSTEKNPAEKNSAEKVSAPREKAEQPRETAAQQRPMLKGYEVPRLEALCHDSRSVIAGKLTQVTDSGCELVCSECSGAPTFGSDAPITINLLDPSSGRSMNVAARLKGVHRRGDNWRLRIFWEGCPELIVQQLENTA